MPERKTIANLLMTAIKPLGSTMYVWGGGWNEEDTGAGVEAISLGVSPRWKEFADKQDETYDFEKTRFQIHDGLDCSGYVGWVIYNVMENVSEKQGYVMSAGCMAEEYAKMGWGKFIPAKYVSDWKTGDIMSAKGHVWIVVGMCEDGSVVLLHSSPPGVILCGTPANRDCSEQNQDLDTFKSQAIQLAEKYMHLYRPKWYKRFPKCSRSIAYLKESSQMRWNAQTMSDAKLWDGKSAEEVLEWIFRNEDCEADGMIESLGANLTEK